MKQYQKNRWSGSGGFSMIEVLVASTILIVIVMMLGMLFQQTSKTWRVGVKRADGFMQVRAAIGAIQRDASAAVDSRSLPKEFATEPQQFSGGSLLFYTLTGKGDEDDNRVLTKVTYSSSGQRSESVLQTSGSWGAPKSASVLPSSGRVGSPSRTTLGNFEADYGKGGDLDSRGLPLYITFEAEVSSSGSSLEIGAASAGPDGVFGTSASDPRGKDDIKTWVD